MTPFDVPADPVDLRAAVTDWARRLAALPQAEQQQAVCRSGLSTPTWPVEHGGLGLPDDAAVVVDEVLGAHGLRRSAHDFVGVVLAGHALTTWGSDDQQRELLGPLARGEQFWCQLFSEPGAGSDLAAVSTRATRQDDGSWRLDGQKVWSSLAGRADRGLLLARSEPGSRESGAAHTGLTFFLLDMRSAGVEARPLRQMTGETEFDEVFLTDVAVPDSARLGEVGQGWAVAVSTLMAERSGLSGRPEVGGGLSQELVDRALEVGAWEDPLLRDDLVAAWVEERCLEMTNLRAFASPGAAGAAGSVTKLAQSELLQRLAALRTEVEGGAVSWTEPDGPAAAAAQAFLYSRAYTIAGGTSEIQRSIIGERVLGLPKEPRASRRSP